MNKVEESGTFLIDEESLIKRISKSDREAFRILYTYYLNEVYQYLSLFTKSKETCEEIAQTLFMKIWERRSELSDIVSFRYYLYRCAKNMLIDDIRRNRRIIKAHQILKSESEGSRDTSDSKVIYKENFKIIQTAINYLPPKRKQIVEMHTIDQYSFDEIANKLAITKSVVKKQLYAGKHFIRNYLKKHGELDM